MANSGTSSEMKEIDRLLVFDLKGKLAHFRKFYTSSSSLSYAFPPRTAITGLVAGILGRERDKYYEEFDIVSCKIALSIRNPLRKIMQTVNYIRTKEEDGYSTAKGVIRRFIEKQTSKYPTPLELIAPVPFAEEIIYRVYFYHNNEPVMNEMLLMLKAGKTKYPIYFGLSEFLATAKLIADVPSQNIIKISTEETVAVDTVCISEHITELAFEATPANAMETLQYVEEKMPLEFAAGREIKRTASFIHEKNHKSIMARLKKSYTAVTYVDEGQNIKENITFME